MNRKIVLFFAAFWLTVFLPLFAQSTATPQRGKTKEHAQTQGNGDSERGSRVFAENCSRCHNAPQGFPPQISATILRHMRIRASLSADDEKALLRFMNP